MLLKKYFGSIYTKPLNVTVNSRDAFLYLFRFIFCTGVWPLPKRRVILYIVWSVILNLLVMVYMPIGFFLSYVNNTNEFSPGEFLSSLQVGFNVWAGVGKMVAFRLMLHRLNKTNEILDEMDQRCTPREEQQKIRLSVALGNRVMFICTILYLGCTSTNFINAVFRRRPPYGLYIPLLNWSASKTQFWIQTFLEIFTVHGSLIYEISIDCYPIIYVISLRTHVNILKERLLQLGTKETQSNDDLYNDLINCILDHKNIIRYYNTINPIIGTTIFIQYLVTGIAMGVTSINLLLYADFYSGVTSFLFLVIVLLQTAPLSFLCSFLMHDGSELSDAAFQSNWTHTEIRYKKTLVYFIQNLQIPMGFKAINIIPINITSIISIMKFAFSVFTLVKEMNLAERIAKSE